MTRNLTKLKAMPFCSDTYFYTLKRKEKKLYAYLHLHAYIFTYIHI